MLNLANLGQVGLAVTHPCFTLLVVLLRCSTCFAILQFSLDYQFVLLSSTQQKQIGKAFLDTDGDWTGVKPSSVQSRCGGLSRIDIFC